MGPNDASANPFLCAELPSLGDLLGGVPTLDEPRLESDVACSFPLDALLGVDGRPQSGTGQTSLFTGLNAVELFGRHFGPWTPVKLRPLLATHNVLKRARDGGKNVAFANAYPLGYPAGVSTRRQAAPPLAALSVDALNRHHEELSRGAAVASGIENTGWIKRLGYRGVPVISARRAGENLAGIAADHDFTVFAHYDTDHAGHRGTMADGVAALERVDRFLGGLVGALPTDTALVVASDHGNIEEDTGKHTLNPVLGLVHSRGGPLDGGQTAQSIMDIPDLILGLLGIPA